LALAASWLTLRFTEAFVAPLMPFLIVMARFPETSSLSASSTKNLHHQVGQFWVGLRLLDVLDGQEAADDPERVGDDVACCAVRDQSRAGRRCAARRLIPTLDDDGRHLRRQRIVAGEDPENGILDLVRGGMEHAVDTLREMLTDEPSSRWEYV